MALRKEITKQILDLLMQNPQGLSITEMVRSGTINRNTAGRYLDNLLVSGQVEMRHFGMAKIYTLSRRLPVSSVLSISSEHVMQLDSSLRIIFLNQPFLDRLGVKEKDIIGKNIEFSPLVSFFDDTFPTIISWINNGLTGTDFRSELEVPRRELFFFCRIAPTVFNNGQKGVSVLFEDITQRKQDEARIRESEARLRSLISVAPIGIGVLSNRIQLEVNDRICRMTGYEAAELVGQSSRKLYPTQEEFDRVGAIHYGNTPRIGEESVETRWRRKDGSLIDVLLSSTPLSPEVLADGFLFAVLDITERKRAEERLRLLKISVDNSYDEVFWMDLKGNILYVNDAACKTTGYSQQELCAMNISGLVPDLKPEEWELHYTDLRQNKKQFFQSRHRRKDGVIIDVEVGSIYVSQGEEEFKICFVRDITERKRAEETLRESEARYRTLSEASQDAIFVIDRDDQVLYINQQVADLLQKPAGAVIGQPWRTLVHTELFTHQYEALRNVFRTGLPERSEGSVTIRNEVRWLDYALVPIPGPDGNVASVMGVSRDITERKRAEEELWKSRQLLAKAMDIACMANWEFDGRTGMFTFDDRFYALYGTTTEREGGSQMSIVDYVREFVHPDDHEIITNVVEKIRQTTDPRSMIQVEHRIIRRDGAVRHIVVRVGVVTDDEGRPIKSFGANQDITDRKNIEEALRQSEEKFRTLVETSSDFIWEVDDHAVYTYISPKIRDILGYDPKEVVGKTPFDLMPPDEAARVAAEFNRYVEERQPITAMENINLHKNGTAVILETSGVPWFYREGTFAGYRGIDRNITARKQAESALRKSEAWYRTLSEASQDMIFVIDRDDRVLYINQQAADFIRKPADTVIGKPRSALFSPDVADHQHKALQYVFTTGLPARSEGSMKIHDEIRWFDHALVPIPGPDGKVASVMGVSRDITKRISAELEQQQNEQNNRFIAEHSVDIIIRCSPENRCIFVSRAITTILGYTEQELLGRSMMEFVHPEDVPAVMKEVELILRSGRDTVTTIYRIRHKAGHYLPFESTTRIVRDEAGRIREYLSISRDITARTRAGSQ